MAHNFWSDLGFYARQSLKWRNLEQPLGWRCPVCGRGLAPHVSVCDCTTSLELLDCLSKLDVEHPPPEA